MKLQAVTLAAIEAEAMRAHAKHGAMTLNNPSMPLSLKLAALMEEVGEVARELTYDAGTNNGPAPTNKDKLVKELIQVANLAAAWAESVDNGGT